MVVLLAGSRPHRLTLARLLPLQKHWLALTWTAGYVAPVVLPMTLELEYFKPVGLLQFSSVPWLAQVV